MAVNIGPRIGIEGENEYRKSLLNIIETQKTLNAELKEAESAWDKDTSAKEKATQKAKLLNQQIKTQKDRIDMLKDGRAKSAQQFGENDTKTLKWRQALAEANTELHRLEGELRDVPSDLQLIGQKFEAAGQKIQDAGQKIKAAGDKLSSVGSTLTRTVTAPVLAAAGAAIKLGSDYEENVNKVDVAFKGSSKEVKKWAKTATRNFGMSESAALEATSAFGDMATSMGLSDDEAAEMSINLAGLSGDLSSFKNIDIQTAMTALKGVFTGETESLKGLGVVMTETNLKGFAEDLGLVYGNMTEAEKVTLRYQYVMEKTANAQGDYLRTSDGFANSFRTLKAEVSNLGASFGNELLPYITPLVRKATELVKGFADLDESTKQMIIKSAGLAAATGPLLVVGGKLVSGIGTLVEGAGKAVEWIGKAIPKFGGLVSAIGPVAAAFGLAAGAGALLGFALKDLSEKYGWSSNISEFNEAVLLTADAAKKARDRVEDTTEALKNTSENAATIMEESEAAATLTDRYADELYDLAGKTNRTEEEQRRLEAVVSSLNKLYPGFTEAVLDSNGAVTMGTDDLKDYIEQLKATAKIEALKRVIDSYTEKIVEADMAVVEAEMALEDATNASTDAMDNKEAVIQAQQEEMDALSRAEQRLAELQNSGTASAEDLAQAQLEVQEAFAEVNNGLVEVNGETVNYDEAVSSLADSSNLAANESDKLNNAINEAEDAAKKAGDEQSRYQEALESETESLQASIDKQMEAASATDENAASAEAAGEAYSQYGEDVDAAAAAIAEAQEKIQEAYQDAYDSSYESIMGQKSLFEVLEKQESTSIEKMRQGLQSHIEAYRNWNDNAKTLMESSRYATDENFRAIVNAIVGAGEEAAPELAALTEAFRSGDAQLEEIVKEYGEMDDLAGDTSEYIAAATVAAEHGLDGLETVVGNSSNKVEKAFGKVFGDSSFVTRTMGKMWDNVGKVMGEKASNTGATIASEYGSGLASGEGDVESGYGALEQASEDGNKKILQQKTQATTAGKEIGGGLASGVRAQRADINSAFTSLRTAISTNLTSIQGLKSTARTAGRDISVSMSDGVNAGKSGVSLAMTALQLAISDGIKAVSNKKSDAKTAAQGVADAVKEPLQNLANSSDPSTWGRHVGDNFANGLGGANGTASMNGRKIADAARTPLAEADNQDPWTWGRHMGDNFANGIGSAYGNVVYQANRLANAVSNILRHSTPKEGPLKDDDVWGLHLGQNFAAGMRKAVPLVESAAMSMADAVVMPTSTVLDIDAVSGRNVANTLTSVDIMDAVAAAAGQIDWKVVIGNREFGRVLRDQGVYA